MRRHAAQRIALGSRAVYIIRIQGFLDQQWQAEMGSLHIASYLRGDGSVSPVTILVGEVADQAALEGILSLIYELGLPLLEVVCLGEAVDAQTCS